MLDTNRVPFAVLLAMLVIFLSPLIAWFVVRWVDSNLPGILQSHRQRQSSPCCR